MEKQQFLVDKVIRNSDIVLIVIDARMIDASVSKFIEDKINRYRKRYLYVINKIDLISYEEQKKIKLKNSVQISATKHIGTLRLLKKIKELARGKHVSVGVVGYPNTGKSSLINALKGKKSAPTSPISGYTKALQKLRITRDIMMMDTPGVLTYSKKPELLLIGILNPENIEDPEEAVVNLIKALDGKIEKYFNVKRKKDFYRVLEDIALKKNILKKKGEPDTKRMAIELIRMCQRGKIRFN